MIVTDEDETRNVLRSEIFLEYKCILPEIQSRIFQMIDVKYFDFR